jgi:hypothetical protein
VDRRRPFATLLNLGLTLSLVLVLAVGAASPEIPIKEARWTAPDKRADALSTRPKECLTLPAGGAALTQMMVGRAAFNTPNLLGGQAARAGLSCASCHVNGRGNPHFIFPGLSGLPGTADVTSSIMSKTRGDGVINPKQIPDLAMDAPKIARDADRPALRDFIRGLVAEEFDGAEPPAAVLEGLAAYVRALSPDACGDDKAIALTLRTALSEVIDPTEVALRLWKAGDSESARLMIAASRAALGRIHERFEAPELGRERKHIEALDTELRTIQLALDRKSNRIDRSINKWQRQFAGRAPGLLSAESRSLFAADQIRRRL